MISKSEIEYYLSELNRKMCEQDIKGEIVLCGGAVMTMVYEARQSTKDIDALFEPSSQIHRIIEQIALENGLKEDWLNDAAKGFIDTSRMNIEIIREYSNLSVRVPDAEAMLAMKLSSARLVGKDIEDALFLMEKLNIKSEKDLFDIIERNVPKYRQTPMVLFFTQEIFHKYSEKKIEEEPRS